tara:strand:+ start:1260 stop:1658 length:399 start_codon:yes stop_codon:yes gene_type:complete
MALSSQLEHIAHLHSVQWRRENAAIVESKEGKKGRDAEGLGVGKGSGPKQPGGKVLERFVLGGIACVCAALVTNPIDCIKTRLQMRGERGGVPSNDKYRGFLRTGATIVKEESWMALYKGSGRLPLLWAAIQ